MTEPTKAGRGYSFMAWWSTSVSVLQIVEASCGWSLIDDGKPSLWFPERDKALEIANIMADARNLSSGVDAVVQSVRDGKVEVLANYRGDHGEVALAP